MQTFLAFIVAILILVSLHEFGHYIVARWCGVKVVRFSVGFGKPFFTRKRGEYRVVFCPDSRWAVTLKMVDTREGEVAEADLPYAFDKTASGQAHRHCRRRPFDQFDFWPFCFTV